LRLITDANSPDLILLDLGLPDGDGKGLIKTVRSELSYSDYRRIGKT
jgi:DNA-binding response OmpR family regulator